MKKIGFDNDKYLKMQSEHIRERISKFGDKLYLEFGGKLFDDYHASRVHWCTIVLESTGRRTTVDNGALKCADVNNIYFSVTVHICID